MKAIFGWIKNHLPSKRRLIQLYSALLFNANLKGYLNGHIFKGDTKYLCAPGLNCYSCPGAVTACPLGALQNALAASGKRTPYYIFGILMLYGIFLGRWICGFLCPFGFLQDLLYKIKTPKLKKNRVTKVLSCFKYLLLILFVVVFPLMYAFRDYPLPAFCKYICPAGTFGGALGLLQNSANEGMFAMLGPLFTWKFILMVSCIVSVIFIYRAFCRFICPLGALYGLFNRFAILGIKLEKSSCISCGRCINKCKMDISSVGDRECINCGECISVCPTEAISYRGGSIILPKNEIERATTEEEKEAATKKRNKRKFTLQLVAFILALSLLFGALIYYNFVDKVNLPSDGYDVGQVMSGYDLRLALTSEETVNIEDYRGKVVIVNFWGTWCSGCVKELPDFNRIANDYKDDDVVVIAIHTAYIEETAKPYIEEHFKDSSIVFALDDFTDDSGTTEVYYNDLLSGSGSYPMTLVVNANGVITKRTDGEEMTYADLEEAIDEARRSIVE